MMVVVICAEAYCEAAFARKGRDGRKYCDVHKGKHRRGYHQVRTCAREGCEADLPLKARQYCLEHSRSTRRKKSCVCGKPIGVKSKRCRQCAGKLQRRAHAPQRNKEGYVVVWAPDHPHSKTGHVREHRMVMEQHLGRFLTPSENVHHKNGVRDDNRIENLELWSKAQPAGQRAIDKLDWAREIIALYGDDEEKLRSAA